MKTNRDSRIKILVESALCVAAAVVLSLFTIFRMPLGGSVTPFATLPIIVVSLRHGSKWGIASALVYSLTQLTLGFSNVVAVPVRNLWSMAACALLDYVLAYTLLGLTGAIVKKFRIHTLGLSVGVIATGLGRLACSFLSGIIVWGTYAPEGWSVAYYSLAYNATWCLPDVAITLVVCVLLSRVSALGLFPAKARVKI